MKLANGADANNAKITNVGTPTAGTDAVNKAYADSLTSGGLIDGGNASSTYSGAVRLDFGSAT